MRGAQDTANVEDKNMSKKSGKARSSAREGRPGGARSQGIGRVAANPRRGLIVAVVVIVLVGLVATGGVFGYGLLSDRQEAPPMADTVTIETTKGTIVMEVYPELMPVTVANFERLAESGFYDGLIWHRVEDWVVQTGDPTGTGMGGSGQRIKLEVNPKLKNVRGGVGMARSQDPDSATSQFYILKSDAGGLDGKYAVFGKVIEGLDVVDKLTTSDKMIKVTVERATRGAGRQQLRLYAVACADVMVTIRGGSGPSRLKPHDRTPAHLPDRFPTSLDLFVLTPAELKDSAFARTLLNHAIPLGQQG